jgi:2-haloacid dehalogenase
MTNTSTFKTYVFDAYGTLLDVHSAVARHRTAAGPDAERFSEIWRNKQLEYTWTLTLAGRYVDFWTLTSHALDFALERFPSVDRALRPRLLDAYRTLSAFAEVPATLAALKTGGSRLAVLSNGTPDMLSAALAGAGLDRTFDAIFSVHTLRIYKPRPEVYRLVTRSLAVAPSDVAFVSSNRWDVMGAVAFGFKAFWVNRTGAPNEYAELAPLREIADLAALANVDR